MSTCRHFLDHNPIQKCCKSNSYPVVTGKLILNNQISVTIRALWIEENVGMLIPAQGPHNLSNLYGPSRETQPFELLPNLKN